MIVLYTDGGCSNNNSRDMSKRMMVAVVCDESGAVLIEKIQTGGSNNIAELLAVKEALLWAVVHKVGEVHILTDSKNNLAWVFGKKVGKKVNDRDAVFALKAAITAALQDVNLKMDWIPRERNLAGNYIESKYGL